MFSFALTFSIDSFILSLWVLSVNDFISVFGSHSVPSQNKPVRNAKNFFMTITKTHLKYLLSARLNLPKSQTSQIVEALLEEIKATLSSGKTSSSVVLGYFV